MDTEDFVHTEENDSRGEIIEVETLLEGVTPAGVAENAGDTAAPAPRGRALPTVLCALLCLAGIAAYVIIGRNGILRLRNGGLVSLVSRFVFGGGEIVTVSPLQNEETAAPVQTVTAVTEAQIPEAVNGLVSDDLSAYSPLEIYNETGYGVDAEALLAGECFVFSPTDKVLVIHTHATESYTPEGCADVSDERFRSDNPTENVIAVGEEFCAALEARGIGTVHCTEAFDSVSFTDAYSYSAGAVAKYVTDDPSIKLVFDIHRDAVVRDDGRVVRTDGDGHAQLMLVAGTDEGGADFPGWRDNLAFALRYQSALYGRSPKLVRHVDLRGVSFNEQLAERYLLMEVGCIGNTLAEAKECARTAADVLADILIK